jgi:TusA-related sulfurtransferase
VLQALGANKWRVWMMSLTIVPDLELELTGEICPMTYVRTRLALDRLRPGQILAVTLFGEDPARNVPRSAERQGHEVLARQTDARGVTRVVLRKK